MTPRSRTRVLMLGPAAPVRGGMASMVDALARSSLREQFDLVVVNTGKTTPPGRPWPVGVWAQLVLALRCVAGLIRGRGTIVHIHTCSGLAFWRDTGLALLARLFGRRVVWHIHGGGFEDFVQGASRGQRALMDWVFSSSAAIIVLSESWRARLGRHLSPPRWAVVENGVAPPARDGIAPSPGVALFVGTLDSVKGADDVVEATALAARNGFRGLVRMAGPETAPGQRARLQRLIDRDGLAEQVHLVGTLSDADKTTAFQAAGVFLLPSHVEGLPVSMLEAMSWGLPVIVTDVGAVAEVVTDGVEGFVVKPGDVNALADRLTQLGADSALRQRMGTAARRRVVERFTIEGMAAKVAALYRVLSSRHRGGVPA